MAAMQQMQVAKAAAAAGAGMTAPKGMPSLPSLPPMPKLPEMPVLQGVPAATAKGMMGGPLAGPTGATPTTGPIGGSDTAWTDSMMPKSKSQGGAPSSTSKASNGPPLKAAPPSGTEGFPTKAPPSQSGPGFSKGGGGFSKASAPPGVQTVPKGAGFGTPPPKQAAVAQMPPDRALLMQAEGLGRGLMELGKRIGEAEQMVAKLRDDPDFRNKSQSVSQILRQELGAWIVAMDALRAGVASNPAMLEMISGLDKGRQALELRLHNIAGSIAR